MSKLATASGQRALYFCHYTIDAANLFIVFGSLRSPTILKLESFYEFLSRTKSQLLCTGQKFIKGDEGLK